MTSAIFPPAQAAKAHLLITLVLDASGSMRRDDAIQDLNNALALWRTDLMRRENLRRIGEIAVVTFGEGGARIVDPSGRSRTVDAQPFVTLDEFSPPPLRAVGYSPMVKAILTALEVTDARRQQLKSEGIGMAYRPLIYLITDGAPTDEDGEPLDNWRDLAPALRRREQADDESQILFTCFAVRGADLQVLSALAPKSVHDVSGASFAAVLNRVMKSIETAMNGRRKSASDLHDETQAVLKNIDMMAGWFQSQKDSP